MPQTQAQDLDSRSIATSCGADTATRLVTRGIQRDDAHEIGTAVEALVHGMLLALGDQRVRIAGGTARATGDPAATECRPTEDEHGAPCVDDLHEFGFVSQVVPEED